MRILFDNVQFNSRSGPNSFGKKLAVALSHRGHTIVNEDEDPDVQLTFIQTVANHAKRLVQRLDGVWFNVDQDWQAQNQLLFLTFKAADAVIAQSNFDLQLIEKFFGHHDNITVIPNGTDKEFVESIELMSVPQLVGVEKVWSCASDWRPHKRLVDNVRYFQEHAGSKDCLVIAGANAMNSYRVADPRVFYAGDLQYPQLLSLMRSSDVFLHLAWLDHCPNVVIDAQAAGCHIICSSTGGTAEIAGPDSTVIEEEPWDFTPVKLYEPPVMDFTRKRKGEGGDVSDIADTAVLYERVLKG